MKTQADLLALIGKPSNERLRELHRLLRRYTYGPGDLVVIEKEILAAMSRRAKKKIAADTMEGLNGT